MKILNGIKLQIDTVEGAIEREEMTEAFKHLKIGKAPGPSVAYAETILASGDIGIKVLMELRQQTGLQMLQFLFLKEKEIS